jgi:hypothetical protein
MFDARSYLELFGYSNFKVQGENLMASCIDPMGLGLHKNDDKHRSFGIHMHTGLAQCYTCNMGWNIDQLTAALLTKSARDQGKATFFNEYDAWKWLEEKDWVPEETADTFMQKLKRLNDRQEILTYPEQMLEPYYKKMHKSLFQPTPPNERYFSPEIVRKFKIGFCEYSRRIVVPCWDSLNRLRGVVSRATRADDFIRYGVGTPDISVFRSEDGRIEMDMIFEKGKMLYGENFFTGKDTLLLLESPLDVPWAHMAGLDEHCDIGAMFGATLTKEQERIAQTYEYTILAFDDDNAGNSGRESAIARLLGHTKLYTFDNFEKKDLGQCTLDEVKALPTRLTQVTYSKFKNMKPME